MGLGERYHEPVCTTLRKLAIDFPTVGANLLLQLTIKALNDTLGPERLVHSLLVCGEIPHVFTPSETPRARDMLGERAALAHAARSEMQTIMAKMRVGRALKHSVPAAADCSYEFDDQVLTWREKIVNNHIGEWQAPGSDSQTL